MSSTTVRAPIYSRVSSLLHPGFVSRVDANWVRVPDKATYSTLRLKQNIAVVNTTPTEGKISLCREQVFHYFCICRHCLRGSGGFQQQIPHVPMHPGFGNQGMSRGPMNPFMSRGYGMPPPPQSRMGAAQYGQYQRQPRQDTVCYSCMPGGDVRRRQRRSADEPEGRFIEIHDRNGKATLNTTYPIEIFVSRRNVSRRTPLLELRTSMKQLRDHSRYQIVSGNKDRFFRIHHRKQISVLHFSKNAVNSEGRINLEPAEYGLLLKATTTLDHDSIRLTSFDSETIQDAIEESVSLQVKIFLEE